MPKIRTSAGGLARSAIATNGLVSPFGFLKVLDAIVLSRQFLKNLNYVNLKSNLLLVSNKHC